MKNRLFRLDAALLLTLPLLLQPACLHAQPGVALGGRYIADVIHVKEGAEDGRTFIVHEAEATADFDLEEIAGATGLTAGLHLLATAGGRPNDAAGTLQGVDNVEVGNHRAKLYQAWVEQAFAGNRASLRVGLTDLNADFYQNDSAGLLMGPAFGIGSELAATGPNGPSIFPSTALTARLSAELGEHVYARAAVINAKSGVIGDPDGVDFSMRHGALGIFEAGVTRTGKFAIGAWGYTQRQDDIFEVTASGTPRRRVAAGLYLLADYPLWQAEEGRGLNAFLRIGRSEGKTTPFKGGFQAGLLATAPFAGRPDGQLSFGVQQGQLSRGFRRALSEEGAQASASEWGLELTYSDSLAPFLTIQPDLQYIRRSYSADEDRDTVVIGLRLVAQFGE